LITGNKIDLDLIRSFFQVIGPYYNMFIRNPDRIRSSIHFQLFHFVGIFAKIQYDRLYFFLLQCDLYFPDDLFLFIFRNPEFQPVLQIAYILFALPGQPDAYSGFRFLPFGAASGQ